LCLVLVGFCVRHNLAAQDFFDDFERADGLLDGWTVIDGSWNIVDGVLEAGPAGATEQHAFVGDPAQSVPSGNYVFSVDMAFRIDDQQPVGRHAGVSFCVDTPGTRGQFSGYLVWWIDRGEDRGLTLTRRDAGTLNNLVRGAGDPLAQPPTNLTIEVDGPTIRVLADDALVIEHDDSTYRGGHFGLWTWSGAGQHVAYDNVLLEVEVPEITACFSRTPTIVSEGGDVTFDGSCSAASEGEIVRWSWTFGDGATAQGQVVEHTYEFADNYVVSLEVEDDRGNVDSVDQRISVVGTILPFEDEFDGAAGPPADWTIVSGDWNLTEDGQLSLVTNGSEAFIWAGNPAGVVVGDITIDVEIDVESWTANADGVARHAGIFFLAQEPTTRQTTPCYDVWWIDRPQDFGLGFHYWNGAGGLEFLGDHTGLTHPELRDPPRRWTVTVEGPTIRAYGDGILLSEIVDDRLPREGHVGLWGYSNGQNILFESFSVRSGVHPPTVEEIFPCARASKTIAGAGDDITFDASCTTLPEGDSVTAWRWDFGDGQSAAGEVVEHSYEFEGDYVVELTIEHTGGPDATVQIAISIIKVVELPISENFDDLPAGPNVPGWTVFQGDWSVSDDGRLDVAANAPGQAGEAHIWIGDPPFFVTGDFTLEFEIEFLNHSPDPLDGVGKHAGVFFYASDPGLRWNINAYDVWWIDRQQDYGMGLNRWIPLTHLSPGTGIEHPDLLGSQPPSVWRIEVEGPTIRVYGDERLMIERQDETRREGYVGFWAYGNNQHVRFDNVCLVDGPAPGSPECDDVERAPILPCFDVAPMPADVDEDLTFDSSCTVVRPDAGEITGHFWDFGDGNEAEGELVEHAYEAPGSYLVTLRIEHADGDPATTERTVRVVEIADLPISDDFDAPAGEVPGWTVSSGEWSITDDGQLEGRGFGDEAQIWLGSPPQLIEGDVTIEFEIEFPEEIFDPVGKHGAVFFYAEEPISRWNTSAYDVWWIDRLDDFGMSGHFWPGIELLAPPSGDLFATPPRVWRIEVDGPTIRAFGDGDLVFEAQDERRRSGYFGFWAHSNNQRILVDNLCIVEGPFAGSPDEVDCAEDPGNGGDKELFVRGDTNGDNLQNLTDGIFVLSFLFTGGDTPACMDSADVDDTGNIEITDGISILNFLFIGGAPPPSPYPDCGEDETDDGLDCAEFDSCP